MLLLLLVVLGCGGDGGEGEPVGVADYVCAEGWARGEVGGCGPAAIVCAEGGGAREACAPESSVFRRSADGTISGAWDEAVVPPVDLVPEIDPAIADGAPPLDVGIDVCPAGWSADGAGACDPATGTACTGLDASLPGGCTAIDVCPAGEYADLPAEAAGARVVHVREGADPATADGSEARPYPTISSGAAAGADAFTVWVRVAAGTYRERVLASALAGTDVHVLGACPSRVVIEGPTSAPVVTADATEQLDVRGVRIAARGYGARAVGGGRLRLSRVRVEVPFDDGVVAEGAGSVAELDEVVVARATPTAYVFHGLKATLAGRLTARRTHVSGVSFFAVQALDGGTVELEDAHVLGHGGDESNGPMAFGGGVLTMRRSVVERTAGIAITIGDGAGPALLEDVVVRDARPDGTGFGLGIAVEAASLRATRVLVRGAPQLGLQIGGSASTAALSRVVIQETRRGPDGAAGIDVASGATLTADHLLLERNDGDAITGSVGARIVLEGAVVRGDVARGAGLGVTLTAGATLEGTHVAIEDVLDHGVNATGLGTEVRLRGSAIRRVEPTAAAPGVGLAAERGAVVTLERSIVEDVGGRGIGVNHRDSRVTVADSIVRRIRAVEMGAGFWVGAGLQASGAALTIERSRLEDLEIAGVAATGLETNVSISDSVLSAIRAGPGPAAAGLAVEMGAVTEAARVRVSGVEGAGVYGSWSDTFVTVEDSVVQDVTPAREGLRGYGLAIVGGSLRATRVVVERATTVGVLAGVGDITLEDCAVRSTSPNADGAAGRGLQANPTGSIVARRTLVEASSEIGIAAVGLPEIALGRVELEDVLVSAVVPSRFGMGIGIATFGGPQVTARRLAVTGTSGAALAVVSESFDEGGMRFDRPGTMTVEDLFVRDVRSATLRVEPTTEMRAGAAVAYGLHVGAGSRLEVSRGWLEDLGYGAFAGSGEIVLREGLIRRAADAAAAQDATGSVVLEHVVLRENALDGVVEAAELPTASALPAPSGLEL